MMLSAASVNPRDQPSIQMAFTTRRGGNMLVIAYSDSNSVLFLVICSVITSCDSYRIMIVFSVFQLAKPSSDLKMMVMAHSEQGL